MKKNKLIEIQIRVKSIQQLDLPISAQPLSVEVLVDKIFLHFLVSSYADETIKKRNIKIYKSGEFVPEREEFIGTFQLGDSMVFHVFID